MNTYAAHTTPILDTLRKGGVSSSSNDPLSFL
jgi:hypothetical protein